MTSWGITHPEPTTLGPRPRTRPRHCTREPACWTRHCSAVELALRPDCCCCLQLRWAVALPRSRYPLSSPQTLGPLAIHLVALPTPHPPSIPALPRTTDWNKPAADAVVPLGQCVVRSDSPDHDRSVVASPQPLEHEQPRSIDRFSRGTGGKRLAASHPRRGSTPHRMACHSTDQATVQATAMRG